MQPALGRGEGDGPAPAEGEEVLLDAVGEDHAGSPSEIQLYPGLPHGFFADYRPSDRRQAAEEARTRLQAWFKAHGVA